jgi:hypothetical protein
MNDQPAGPARSAWAAWFEFPVHRSVKVGLGVAAVMVLLALVGVGLTTTDKRIAPKYWMALVPVYGVLCVVTAWVRSPDSRHVQVVRQLLHWLAIAGGLLLDFTIRGSGEETGVAAGYNALLLLALGCLLAGVHLDWPFALVGMLLTATLLVVVRAEQYLWLVVVAGILVIALIVVVWRIAGRRFLAQRRPDAK